MYYCPICLVRLKAWIIEPLHYRFAHKGELFEDNSDPNDTYWHFKDGPLFLHGISGSPSQTLEQAQAVFLFLYRDVEAICA